MPERASQKLLCGALESLLRWGELGHTELYGRSPLKQRRKYRRQHDSCNGTPC
jgi:hypothetical protein